MNFFLYFCELSLCSRCMYVRTEILQIAARRGLTLSFFFFGTCIIVRTKKQKEKYENSFTHYFPFFWPIITRTMKMVAMRFVTIFSFTQFFLLFFDKYLNCAHFCFNNDAADPSVRQKLFISIWSNRKKIQAKKAKKGIE